MRVGLALRRRQRGGDPVGHLRAEIEPRHLRRMRRKPYPGYVGDNAPHLLRDYGAAVGKARIAARRRLLALGDPAIQAHQQSAQQRVVIDRIERLLATFAVLRVNVGQRQGAGGMLRTGEVVEA